MATKEMETLREAIAVITAVSNDKFPLVDTAKLRALIAEIGGDEGKVLSGMSAIAYGMISSIAAEKGVSFALILQTIAAQLEEFNQTGEL